MQRLIPRLILLVSASCVLASCGTGRESAPAWGMVGGTVIGAAIGSFSGNAGEGAHIGALLGTGSGHLIAAAPPSGPPPEIATSMIRSSDKTIRRAEQRNRQLQGEFGDLVVRHSRSEASGGTNDGLLVRSLAASREREAGQWAADMKQVSDAMELALRGRTSPGGRNYSRIAADQQAADALTRSFKEHAKRFRGLARGR
ncbi:hypothetical protein OKA05_08115 [Luteolibacter arcticus]|uniref:Glycine zipper domain-containing protein n=1 Tax=Luteolibacter arcticus TaxID=1581411 RepID=A0ABT3GFY4_9BACT|nr:hypothetical protein [Luteolibacter arcticus]MCW1922516.1 hypothetical protein [Luteolibacter arcticus]